MTITPDGAQKLLRSLEEERKELTTQIEDLSTFVVAVSEGNPEELRPTFDFMETVKKIECIDNKIRKIKHYRNIFNTNTKLESENMTIDEALVYMAVLNKNYAYFIKLGNTPERKRLSSMRESIEYEYVNYDINEVKQYGKGMYEKLLQIQSELNRINSTYTFEINL